MSSVTETSGSNVGVTCNRVAARIYSNPFINGIPTNATLYDVLGAQGVLGSKYFCPYRIGEEAINPQQGFMELQINPDRLGYYSTPGGILYQTVLDSEGNDMVVCNSDLLSQSQEYEFLENIITPGCDISNLDATILGLVVPKDYLNVTTTTVNEYNGCPDLECLPAEGCLNPFQAANIYTDFTNSTLESESTSRSCYRVAAVRSTDSYDFVRNVEHADDISNEEILSIESPCGQPVQCEVGVYNYREQSIFLHIDDSWSGPAGYVNTTSGRSVYCRGSSAHSLVGKPLFADISVPVNCEIETDSCLRHTPVTSSSAFGTVEITLNERDDSFHTEDVYAEGCDQYEEADCSFDYCESNEDNSGESINLSPTSTVHESTQMSATSTKEMVSAAKSIGIYPSIVPSVENSTTSTTKSVNVSSTVSATLSSTVSSTPVNITASSTPVEKVFSTPAVLSSTYTSMVPLPEATSSSVAASSEVTSSSETTLLSLATSEATSAVSDITSTSLVTTETVPVSSTIDMIDNIPHVTPDSTPSHEDANVLENIENFLQGNSVYIGTIAGIFTLVSFLAVTAFVLIAQNRHYKAIRKYMISSRNTAGEVDQEAIDGLRNIGICCMKNKFTTSEEVESYLDRGSMIDKIRRCLAKLIFRSSVNLEEEDDNHPVIIIHDSRTQKPLVGITQEMKTALSKAKYYKELDEKKGETKEDYVYLALAAEFRTISPVIRYTLRDTRRSVEERADELNEKYSCDKFTKGIDLIKERLTTRGINRVLIKQAQLTYLFLLKTSYEKGGISYFDHVDAAQIVNATSL